jgi:hypothetical protein
MIDILYKKYLIQREKYNEIKKEYMSITKVKADCYNKLIEMGENIVTNKLKELGFEFDNKDFIGDYGSKYFEVFYIKHLNKRKDKYHLITLTYHDGNNYHICLQKCDVSRGKLCDDLVKIKVSGKIEHWHSISKDLTKKSDFSKFEDNFNQFLDMISLNL